jgi:hypothetical protein
MASFRYASAVADARTYTNAAAFDIQKLGEESIETQALHNLLSAVQSLINAIDDDGDDTASESSPGNEASAENDRREQ